MKSTHAVSNIAQPPRQYSCAPTRREERRFRYAARLSSAPDAAPRLVALFARIERQYGIDRDDMDRVLDAAIAADPRAIAFLAAAR
jgi:hypothetical protein